MIEKVEGIIVSEVPYGDTSKIVNIFTKEHGLIGVIAKGAKSMKSHLRGVTTKFTYAFFHIYYKKDKLSLLKDVDIIDSLNKIKTDLKLIGYMSYITELSTQVYKQNNVNEIFPLYIETVKKLELGFEPIVLSNILEVKYLDYLGISLNLESCINCGNRKDIVTVDPDQGGYICKNCYRGERLVSLAIIKLLRMYYLVDIKSITSLKLKKDNIEQVNYFLTKYYERYTGLYLKSKDFLEQVA